MFSRTYSLPILFFFFFNDTATTEIYTLSLHDALPISRTWLHQNRRTPGYRKSLAEWLEPMHEQSTPLLSVSRRSEEHTSELQSHSDLVCRLLLEKKKKTRKT